jgi:hypothetical protein
MSGFNSIWQIAPRQVAAVLGVPFAQYRPAGAGAVLTTGNLQGTVPVWITADDKLMAAKALPEKTSRAFAAFDPAVVRVADYLVGAMWAGGQTDTWFVQSMDLPAPISVVRCNRVLTFSRPGSPPPGASFYGGDNTATEAVLLTAWPASVMQGTKGQTAATNLPGDDRLPWVNILMPTLPVQIRAGDFALDDQAQPMRYEISGAVETPMGWQITAALAVA